MALWEIDIKYILVRVPKVQENLWLLLDFVLLKIFLLLSELFMSYEVKTD